MAKAEEDFFSMINADKKKREKQMEKMREEEDNKKAEEVSKCDCILLSKTAGSLQYVCTFLPFYSRAKKRKNDLCGTYDFLGEP